MDNAIFFSLSHTVEIKMILKSNKREDKETRI